MAGRPGAGNEAGFLAAKPSGCIFNDTQEQRMLATLRGDATDRIPWVPRLDLWHRANLQSGTLPGRFRNASLMQMLDELGWGYHAVIPAFRDLRSQEDDIDRGLGIHNLHALPCRTLLHNVQRNVRTDGDRTIVTYHTPVGDLCTTVVYTREMRQAGVTITHVEEYPFKTVDDYAPLEYLFENASVEPNYDGYIAFAQSIGQRSFVVGYASSSASPMHYIQRELMPVDVFFFEMADRAEELYRLAEKISRFWQALVTTASSSPAEIVMVGANYDASIQYPPFFAEHIVPSLSAAAAHLHAKGKYLLTHSDGENRGLLEHYLACLGSVTGRPLGWRDVHNPRRGCPPGPPVSAGPGRR